MKNKLIATTKCSFCDNIIFLSVALYLNLHMCYFLKIFICVIFHWGACAYLSEKECSSVQICTSFSTNKIFQKVTLYVLCILCINIYFFLLRKLPHKRCVFKLAALGLKNQYTIGRLELTNIHY